MKNTYTVMFIYVLVLMTIMVFLTTPCLAQLWSPNPFIFSFIQPIYPYNPFLPASLPVIPIVGPILPPYTAGLPTLGRFADATFIIILNQPTNTVTAYAPLGTVTLTPSAFVPLGLFLTLAE